MRLWSYQHMVWKLEVLVQHVEGHSLDREIALGLVAFAVDAHDAATAFRSCSQEIF